MPLSARFAENLWVRTAFGAAGHTLLVYDYFLSLGDEVSYIWNSPWTVVKVMFLVNRYGNLVGQTFIRLEEAGILADASIHILVLTRAWAIWGTRKRVTQILILGYIGYVLVLMGSATYGINNKHVQFPHLNLLNVCVGAMPHYTWLSHVASFILNTLVFVLTMRSLRKYSIEFKDLYPSGLLHILVRDAIIFFVVSVFSEAFTIASWIAFSQDPRYFLPKAFSSPLLSVAGQRLVLNLKSLKTRTYTSRDLSREVERQLEAFGEANNSIALDDMGNLDNEREGGESEIPSSEC